MIACVGGGSNAIGLFHAFLARYAGEDARRGSGRARKTLGEHAARLGGGEWFHRRAARRAAGNLHIRLADYDGQIATTHSVSAGLDYPGVGPEHAWLAEQGRAEYTAVSDERSDRSRKTLARLEGIIPALESAHALAELIRRAPQMKKDEMVILNVSGRGDKDMETLSRYV